jgi:EmrB/QacA subfamily drug resistance transporter
MRHTESLAPTPKPASRSSLPEAHVPTGPQERFNAKQIWTLVLASVGVFMTALDTLVVTTALPVLRVSLHSSLSGLEWTVNAYNLAFACSLLTGAALGDRFGRRRMLCTGLAVFTLASMAAALSSTLGALVAARVVQGAGAALVMPLTLTLVSQAFPPEKRGMAIGVWGGITGLAVAAGPVVGGAAVQGANWHWIFWLNVPIGAALVPLVWSRLDESFGPRPGLDVVGLALAGAGLFAVTWGLVRANTLGWSDAQVVGSLLAGAVLVALFLGWEARATGPMLSLGLFRQPRFAGANAASFFLWAGLFGALFLMSQFFQSAQGLSPLQTGVRLLAWSAPPMVVSPLAGKLADRYGNWPFMTVGLLMQAAGLAWVAGVARPHIGFGGLVAALLIAGTGTSLVFPTVANEVMASVPATEIGVASGTNSAVRELGGVLGVAVLASVFSRPGVYTSSAIFVDGFRAALWVAAGFSVAGAAAALAGARLRPAPLGRVRE